MKKANSHRDTQSASLHSAGSERWKKCEVHTLSGVHKNTFCSTKEQLCLFCQHGQTKTARQCQKCVS